LVTKLSLQIVKKLTDEENQIWK